MPSPKLPVLLCFAMLTIAYSQALPLECTGDIMTTPRFGTANAVFTACSNLTIPSSPSTLYNVLADFPRYHEWNSFVYDVDLPVGVETVNDLYVDMPMTFHTSGLIPGVNTTSNERITGLEPGLEMPYIAWRYDGGELGDATMQAE